MKDLTNQTKFYDNLYALFSQLSEYTNDRENFSNALTAIKTLLDSYIISSNSEQDIFKSKIVTLKQNIDSDIMSLLPNDRILKNISWHIGNIKKAEMVIETHSKGQFTSPFTANSKLDIEFRKVKELFHNKPVPSDLHSLLEYFRNNHLSKREVSWVNTWNKVIPELNKYFINASSDVKNALSIISGTILKGQTDIQNARKYFNDKLDHNEQSLTDEVYMYSRDVILKGGMGELDKVNASLVNMFLTKLKERVKWDDNLQNDYDTYVRLLSEYPEYFVH